MKKKHILLPLLIVACCAFIAFCLFRAEFKKHDFSDRHPCCGDLSVRLDVPADWRSVYKWADDAEIVRLNSIWAEAATNLVAGNVKEMEEKISLVSERMKCICKEQWIDIVGPFYDLLNQRLDKKKVNGAFASEDEFNAYMAATLRGMNLMGMVELHRYPPSSSVVRWECYAMMTLKAYQQFFSESGQTRLEVCAERFIDQLVEQIESDEGLTRQYMEYLRARDIKVQVEERHVPRDVVVRGIRSHADMLRVAGYAPKWLEEFK